jgi:F-type H+-transporting ATPase subunit a
MSGPLHQFEVVKLFPLRVGHFDVSFTNSALFMGIAAALGALLFMWGSRKALLIPGRMQSIAELGFDFIQGMVEENIGAEGKSYFSFIFSLFMFILFGNLIGMIPYSFTFTSQIILTFSLASIVFILVTLVGFMKHGIKFLGYFVPEGAPLLFLPLLIPIELISYLSRPVSLSIRLFANMMAGHTMMKVFASFALALGVWGVAPMAINAVLTGFEFMVAFLQAYVFSVLTCLYLRDAIHLH